MMFVGDKTQFYNKGLEPFDVMMYRCPLCDAEKEVEVEYDYLQHMWFPYWWSSTVCECGEQMDRKKD